MKDTPKPDNRRKYDAAFRAEALRLAEQSRSTQAESRWSRLKTEVLEGREWPVFADLADAQASVADYLTTTITSVYTPASTIKPRIPLTSNFFKLLP